MQTIKIDFDNPGLPQRLDVVENDAQSRFFKAVLYKDGKAYTAPSGATYSIMYRGFGPQNEGWYDTINDGAGKRAACSVSGNVVTCEIARQALRVPGHVSVVLCVTGRNGYMLHGWPIDCNCRNDNYTGGTSVESFFYITQVTNADWTSAIQTWEELKNMIDPTLSVEGKAADAKETGDKLQLCNGGWTNQQKSMIKFDTINSSVTVDGWYVGNKLFEFKGAKTINYDTTKIAAYIILGEDKQPTITYDIPTKSDITLFIFFTSANVLRRFTGCSLPVNVYTVDGIEYSPIRKTYRGWITQPKDLVEFDTSAKTVHVNGWSVTGKLDGSYNLTLNYDDTKVVAYVVLDNSNLPTITYAEPTADETTLFIFFTNPKLLQGFTGCSLPVNMYTVDGTKYASSLSTIKVNLTSDSSSTIAYEGQNIEINGNSHVIDFGEHFNVSGNGVFNVNYNADANGEVYAVFVSKTKPLITEASRPWPTVCLWAITSSKTIRLKPYASATEVTANENSFTYESDRFVINCNDVSEIVKCPDGRHTYGIKLNNCTGNIRNLTIKYATNDSVWIKDSNININNCTFMYSKSASHVHYTDSSGTIENCSAYYANYDGFGFDQISKTTSGGGTTIINCISAHNFDDGFSHHQNNTTFNLIGCIAFDCGKGGIASPTYSSNGSIHDCYLHDNLYGIYAADSDEYPANGANVMVYNSIITNNQCGIRTDGYSVKLFNCKKVDNKNADVTNRGGSIAEM